MDFNTPFASRYIRVVALISLLLGLNDAARLLGVTTGSQSPLDLLGVTGFVYLSIFALARLFAAVGLQVLAMKRLRVGRISLSRLPPGQWRYLAPQERI